MCDRISVIVTVYNVEAYLEQCLESVTGQTYRNLEIILVDDGSTDNSPQICDRYADRDERVRVIHKKNEGLVRARKTGVMEASSKYVGYVDGDDWIEPEMYERLLKHMKENGADIIASGRIEEYPERSVVRRNKMKAGLYDGDNKVGLYRRMIFSGSFFEFGVFPTVWDKLFRRELLFRNQMQVPDEIVVGEDVACTFPCILEADKIYVTRECLYHYRRRADSMLRTIDRRYNMRVKVLQQYLYERCSGSYCWESLRRQINVYIMDMVLNGASLEYDFRFAPEIGHGFLFPFQSVRRGGKIVLYGAGGVGRQYYRQIMHSGYCEVVQWVDKRAGGLKDMPVVIGLPEGMRDISYDQIVIAVMEEELAEDIKRELVRTGVEVSKIVWEDPVI